MKLPTSILAVLFASLVAAVPSAFASPPAELIVVVGAPGAQQYAEIFDRWSQQWFSLADRAGALVTVIEPDQMDEVRTHLRAVATRHAPFVVALAGTDTFRPISPVVFVAVTEGAEGCAVLHESVVGGPLAQQMRFPFHPHVTIAHDLDDAQLDDAGRSRADFEARFPVAQFALYEYGDDGVWREVEIFPLVAHESGGGER